MKTELTKAVNVLEWFGYHNRNLTKEQMYNMDALEGHVRAARSEEIHAAKYTKGDCYALCEILEHILKYYKHAIKHSASYLGYEEEHGYKIIERLACDINDIICYEQEHNDYTEQMEDIMELKHIKKS